MESTCSEYTHIFNSTIFSLALHRVIDGTFVPASIYGQLSTGNDLEHRSNLCFPHFTPRHGLIDYYNYNQSVARSTSHSRVQPSAITSPMVYGG